MAKENWEEFIVGPERGDFEPCLSIFLREKRWFTDHRAIKSMSIRGAIPLLMESEKYFLATLVVDFVHFEAEEYLFSIGFASGTDASRIQLEAPASVLARAQVGAGEGVLYEASAEKPFGRLLLETIRRRQTAKGTEVSLKVVEGRVLPLVYNNDALEPITIKTEQRNTTIVYGNKFFLKLFRRVEPGINPGLETLQFLAEKQFPHIPAFAGALEISRDDGEHACLGILSDLIPQAENAWQFTLDALRRYFDRVRTLPATALADGSADVSLVELADREVSDATAQVIGTYLESARLLGQRTGALHLALASDPENKDFAPEPFTPFYQRSLYQSFRNHLTNHFQTLRRELKNLPEPTRHLADKTLGMQETMLARFRTVHQSALDTVRIRTHGNYHLGHVLHTGKDFVVIDFEGEPGRSLSERRIKRAALRDVAAMIRSLDYTAHAALFSQREAGNLHEEQLRTVMPWAQFWSRWVSASFLGAYLKTVQTSGLAPKSKTGVSVLLDAFVLDRALTEMGFDLATRPNWLHVSLQSILQLMERSKAQ